RQAQNLPPSDGRSGKVPDFAFNPLYRNGCLYRPILDEQNPFRPRWPNDAPFAVCLTHDLDVVSEAGIRQSLRKIARVWRSRPPPARAVQCLQTALALRRLLQAVARGPRPDPLWCYERWLDAEADVGARSTFFIFPERVTNPHFSDCHYGYRDRIRFRQRRCRVGDFLRALARDRWEIGVHPSWNATLDAEELRGQKQSVEQAIEQPVVSVRHHWLHFDIRSTPRLQAATGLRFDSTLGFNDNVGFRFGTCRPWALRDPQTNQTTGILEIPLIAQDTALLNPMKGLRLDIPTARSYLQQLIEAVQRVAGVFTVSFHPDVIHPTRCPGWFDLYCDLLRELRQRKAWFATVAELGTYWLQHYPSAS
ncbi:MAG: polysaccharide deacetylase family protein, partial [Verrucomicrobiae bacterium]|nr:polysaccharide deacetylase family protein [Verrucomicrobiae bacterium]